MFGVTAPEFQRKHKRIGAVEVGNSNNRIPQKSVVRTFLGKGEGVGKECILFPWSPPQIGDSVYSSLQPWTHRPSVRSSDFSPAQSLRALANIRVRWKKTPKGRVRPETEVSHWAMRPPQDQQPHIFITPFSATKILAWLSALKKQQRWYKGLEGNHVPSEVNKSLSELISTEYLILFPKCMHGI